MNSPHPDHDYYIEGIREHNVQVIKEVYDHFFQKIQYFIKKNKGTFNDAEDVFQEAVMALYLKSKEADFVLQKSLNNWLYIASRNIWLNKLRKKRMKEVTITDTMVLYDKETALLEVLEQAAKTKLFLEKIQQLSQKCQQLLQLFFEKESMKTIAKTMNYSNKNTAKKTKYECVKKLIQLIEKDERYQELR